MNDEINPQKALTRAADKVYSSQPRFQESARQVFGDFFSRDLSFICEEVPAYAVNSRKRDEWLIKFAKTESHLIGALQQAVSIDVNRGWELIGGRNQVKRFTSVLHNYMGAPGLTGWRNGISVTSNSFYNCDINAIVELGRDGKGGPVRGFYHVDPTRCVLTGNIDTPLKYYNGSKYDYWNEDDFMRVSNLPDTREKFNGLGFCAVSRALNLALTMWAVNRHDQESLAARAPKGLLLVTGYSEQDWEDAMEAREEDLTARERMYFGGVAVLATSATEGLDAKLVALSQLPKDLDRKEFIDLTMYGYALAFGYDPSEFWPVQFGSLGRGDEAALQSEKATAKGGLSFALGFQDQVQNNLPDTLIFQFQERDDRGELVAAEVKQEKATFINIMAGMREAGNVVFTNEQIIQLAIDEGLIPAEWSEEIEDTTATDEGEVRTASYQERLLERPEIHNMIEAMPDEEIVRYIWSPEGERILTVWDRGVEAIKRKYHPVEKIRQDENEDEILYESPDGEIVITVADVDRAVETAFERDEETGELITAEVIPE